MLDEYKKLYSEKADIIPNWRKIQRSDLCLQYCKYKDDNDDISESYLGAIMCKFWSVMSSLYFKQQPKVASEEDCYDCLTNAVLTCLINRPWEDPKSSIYKDPKGPEKSINICLKQELLNFIVAEKRHKRVLNHTSLSLEEELSSTNEVIDKTDSSAETFNESESSIVWTKLILDYFNNKDYFSAFALEAILNADLVDFQKSNDILLTEFSEKKLRKYLSSIDDDYCKYFSKEYGTDLDTTIRATKYVRSVSKERCSRNLRNLFRSIPKDILN